GMAQPDREAGEARRQCGHRQPRRRRCGDRPPHRLRPHPAWGRGLRRAADLRHPGDVAAGGLRRGVDPPGGALTGVGPRLRRPPADSRLRRRGGRLPAADAGLQHPQQEAPRPQV
ncbi:MAG: Putative oxidoreductase, partial [uncultured Friedmanniella sp.]